MARGTNRDNPRLPQSRQFWRRYLDRIGSLAVWGRITGTLADQSDLQAALNAKVEGGLLTNGDYTFANTARLLGRYTGGAGDAQEVALSSRIRIVGGTLDISDAAIGTTQMDDASVTGAKIAASTITQANLAYTPAVVAQSVSGNPLASVSATTLTTVASLTIPGATMPGRKVRVVLMGDVVQNSGSTQGVQWQVVLGSTTAHDSSSSLANSANTALWRMELELCAPTAGKQFLVGHYRRSEQSTATSGIGGVTTLGADGVFGNDNIAEDETTDLALAVKARFDTSATSSTLRLFHSEVTYI